MPHLHDLPPKYKVDYPQKVCDCGRYFSPKQPHQVCCSVRCKNRRDNASRKGKAEPKRVFPEELNHIWK